ncbi:hypothetical protein [Streptomyces omiyaensis]|uniref:hypothetical protein n=1 Tax=Streptomyces omiyaensis TaxID=68247 RepID=UPI0036FE2EE6
MYPSSLARCAALGVAAFTLVTVGAVSAAADVYAPYTQAAAHVGRDGTLLQSKNIDTVTWNGGGIYCVHVSDPDINLADSVFTATLGENADRGGSVQVALGRPECGNDPHTIPVISATQTGNFASNEFYLTVQ